MSSLLELIKQRYLDTLRSVPSRWKILIVDQYTQAMLHSVLSTYDVLEEGVQQVDLITAHRAPQPRLAAVYLLMPTTQNVDLVLRDHNPTPPPPQGKSKSKAPQQPPEPPKYGAAYINFLDGINDALVGKLTDGLPEQYLQGLKELYINFHALEPRIFSLRSPHSFFSIYGPPDGGVDRALARWDDDIGWMSRSIVNTLATLGEYPLIRYYNPPSSFHQTLGPGLAVGEAIGKRLAERVQAEIDAYARDNANFPPVSDPPRPRGVLFITDRSMDLNAPFLHEFTYQAMINDLLEIIDGRRYRHTFVNEQGAEEEKEAVLSDEDKVWVEVRHMHMKDALDKLIADFKSYAGEHGGTFGGSGSTSLNDMKDMLASLPQMREVKEKLSLHLTMAEKCMTLFDKKKLPLSAGVEQCCATGVTPEGKTPKTLVEEMVPLLDDRGVSSTDKLRIIALYIMHRDGVPEGDKKRLYQHARLALHEMDAVNNLSYLGVNVNKDSGKKRKPLFKQKEEDDAYDISRYQPAMKYMLEEHFAGSLDQSTFPYVRDAPTAGGSSLRSSAPLAPTSGSLRSARPQWTAQRSKRVVNEPKQRVMVFMAGGATYSEVRTVYKVSEASNKDVFLGTTHLITPQQFASDLANLERGGGAHLAAKFEPPSKSSRIPPARPSGIPQQAFDARYHQQVAAPPPPAPEQQKRAPPPQQQQQQQQQRPAPDARRPNSVASSVHSGAPPSSMMGSSLSQQSSASSVPQSQNGSVKVKKKGFLKRLI
ncbi:hypothetical protein JCM10213_000024 [Rhodosporidiobolus nylandii]